MFYGNYLGIIWIVNKFFKGKFSVYEENWRSSPLCYLAFVFNLDFSLLTPLMILLLSISRLMVVVKPVDTKFKQTRFVFSCVFITYLSSFIVTSSITLVMKVTAKN